MAELILTSVFLDIRRYLEISVFEITRVSCI